MKKSIFLLLAIAGATLMGVSTNAESPPFKDQSFVESKIKQLPVAEFMPVECFTISNNELDGLCSISEVLYFDNPEVKRYPAVQPECATYAPKLGVDGRAVLSWCTLGKIDNRQLYIATRYTEGRATEYRF